MIRMIWQGIKAYQSGSERLGVAVCLPGGFGRLSMGCGWLVDFGRLSASANATSDNQEHEPRSTPATRFALSPPTGILQMDAP
jgi:hypothetical protein